VLTGPVALGGSIVMIVFFGAWLVLGYELTRIVQFLKAFVGLSFGIAWGHLSLMSQEMSVLVGASVVALILFLGWDLRRQARYEQIKQQVADECRAEIRRKRGESAKE